MASSGTDLSRARGRPRLRRHRELASAFDIRASVLQSLDDLGRTLRGAGDEKALGPDLWSVKDRCEVVMPSVVDHRSRQVPVLLL